jgi:SAM-dependent methyltransferase
MILESRFTDLYSQAYDILNQGKDYEAEINFILSIFEEKTSGNKPNSVLDLGCGSGLHIQALPSTIEHVTGVDLSAEMLTNALTHNQKPNVDFINSDIIDFKPKQKFDLVLMLFHVLSYVTDLDLVDKCFKVLHNSVSENGKIVIDFWCRAAWDEDPPVVRETIKELNGVFVKRLSTPTIDFLNGVVKINMDISIEKNGVIIGNITENHTLRAFTISEIEILASANNLKIIEIGDWDGLARNPLTRKSWYGYVVMEKI